MEAHSRLCAEVLTAQIRYALVLIFFMTMIIVGLTYGGRKAHDR